MRTLVRLTSRTRNVLIAAGAALVIGVTGYIIAVSGASGFFAANEAETGTLSGNATTVSDSSASGGKAVQFNAPAAPPPGGGGGGTTTRPDPFPASMKPDATNTGLLPGVALTAVTTDQTYGSSSNGQTISNKDFKAWVVVTGANITFVNCKFEGRAPGGSNHGLIDTEDSTGTITIKDSEFVPASPAATLDGLWTRNTNIYRANIHGTTDGMKADRNTLVQDSYIHDMKWFASDPNQGGGETHNDGVQTFAGEFNVTLRHNNIDLSTVKNSGGELIGNAAWQSSATNSVVANNWLDGGGCTLNFDHKSVGKPITNAVTGNRFGRHQSFKGCTILLSTQASLSQNSGNVWDDTGAAIPAPQQHD